MPDTTAMRVALLVNFIAPYHLPLLTLLNKSVDELRIFVSTPMEPNRDWPAEWGSLAVVVQKGLTWRGRWRHPAGFSEDQYVHVPFDTLFQLRRFQPDVVVSTEVGARSLAAALYRRLRPRTRLVLWLNLSERTEAGRGRLRTWLRRRLLPLADGIFVNGESGTRYLEALGIARSSIYRLPYGTDFERFGRTPLTRTPDEARRLLYVGQLVHRKGIIEFIETLLRWLDEHPPAVAAITVVGDGDLRETLRTLQGRSPRLSLGLAGSVDYADLPGIYAAHGILVLPSLADEWGIVVNEALAAGLPVLGSLHAQAVEDLVEDGVCGWVFDSEDPAAVHAAIERAFATPVEELEQMRVACREKAHRYAADRLIETLMQGLSHASPRAESG